MPEHGLLSCSIELGESNTQLREYGTTYANKTAETYVAIPSQPTPFSIRLNTKGYISPGLAIFVFIDGIYQTNRNKRHIKQPTLDDSNAASFQVRMGKKEDLLKDGRVISRGWWFEKLNIVPADTKGTINEDVMNNIGTIEVIVLRCQDNPKNAPINPFDFPKLPVLIKSLPAANNTKSSSRQSRKAASKKSKGKEPSDDGSMGGMFGLFDGAGDHPTGLDGHYDNRQYHFHRDDGRPRRDSDRHPRHDCPSRTHNPRQRILEEESPKTATTTEEARRPEFHTDGERVVHFRSPVATHLIRQPSDSQYSRYGRDEPQCHFLRRSNPSPVRQTTREYLEDLDRYERRRGSPVRIRHMLNDRDEHHLGRHRSGGSTYDGNRSRSRSTVRESRRSGGSPRRRRWSWGYDEKRGRDRGYVERERYRSRSSRKQERYRDRSNEDKFAGIRVSPKGMGEDPSKRHHQSYGALLPISSDSATYIDQRHLPVNKTSTRHPSNALNTSPVTPRVVPAAEDRQPAHQAGPTHRNLDCGVGFFDDIPAQTAYAPQQYSSHSNHSQNPAPNQYGFGPIPATNGYPMPQSVTHPSPFANQLAFQSQIASGQRAACGTYPVQDYPQQPAQNDQDVRALRPPQGQSHYSQADAPQGPQNATTPQYPQYRNVSRPFDSRFASQYGQTGQMATPIQGNISNHSGRSMTAPASAPAPVPVQAAENPQSLISIIQQLKELGVISVPGQDNNPRGRKKTASSHRQTCPQNRDMAVNSACLKHGDHAESARQHLATWMTGGNLDFVQGKGWFQQLASQHIACTCEPSHKQGPCTCNPDGGNQSPGGGSKSEKKDNTDQQGNNSGSWPTSADAKQGSGDANNNSGGVQTKSAWAGSSDWGNQSNKDGTKQNCDRGKDDTNSWNNNSGGEQTKSAWAGSNGWGNQSNKGGTQQNGDWGKDDTHSWNNNDNDAKSKKDKSGSSKSKSKKSSSSAKEGDKTTAVHEKPYTRSSWKADIVADSANSGKKRGQHYTMPEDPIYTLSESKAKEFNVRHQVRGGVGLEEKKKINRPMYLDNFDEPYAVFRFKYRSRDMLKKILGEDIKESPEEFQEWLSALSKEQLVAEMLRKKASGAWKSDDGNGDESDAGSKGGKGRGDGGWGNDATTVAISGDWNNNNQTTSAPTADQNAWDGAETKSGGVAHAVIW